MDAATAVANFIEVQQIFQALSVLQLTAYLWPKSVNVQDGAHYDFVIVGGGTAGCIIASRLVKFENVKVLLIEAGGDPPFESQYPGFFVHSKHTKNDYNVTSIREKSMYYHYRGVADLTQGKMLGGSSSLNYLAYARGHPLDYDYWADVANDSSWNYESILPLYIRNEKMIDKQILNSPADKALHGTRGPIQLIKYCGSIINKYISAYKEMGFKVVADINDRNPLGVQNCLFMASKTVRQSTAQKFLSPVRNYPNLHVMKHALVTKIIFDKNKNAIGVKVRTNKDKNIIIKADKEVIVTAGVFKSPQLLMVSGIGPRKHLESKNIAVISNLPVGKNLQDHPIHVSIYRMGERTPPSIPNPHKFPVLTLDGYYTFNKSQSIPVSYIINLIIDDPEQFLVFCSHSFSFKYNICNNIVKKLHNKQIYTVFHMLTYPKSRGRVLLNTTDMADQPQIELGYNTNDEDLEQIAENVMFFNAIVNKTFFKSVDAEFLDPELETCAGLDKRSKKYWKCYCFGMQTPGHYLAGTCSMGKVVDAELFVKGVKRLRIADASIMPRIVASTTGGPVMVIAQKASDMIIKKHDLK